jgi:tetratricopeptide (TPR) repeat protein
MGTLSSYTLFLGASGLMNSLRPEEFNRARAVFEHLADRHPRRAAPLAMLARWYVFKNVQGWSTDRDEESRHALDLADRSLAIEAEQAIALSAAGLVRMNYHGDADGALRLYEAAMRADPVEAHAWAYATAAYSFTGRHEEARASAARAIEVSPLDPNLYLFEAWAAMASLGAGQFDEAAAHALASVRLHALHTPSLRMLVAALWLAGRHEEAYAASRRYLAACPSARVGPQRPALPGPQPVWNGAFNGALTAAGLPP